MIKHPTFSKIIMHSDRELAELLGIGIKKRITLHEWPLSCVQKLILEGDSKLIYKAQLPTTVEACFYEGVSSELLPWHRTLEKFGECDTMLMEYIDSPQLSDEVLNDADFIGYGRKIIDAIGRIGGKPPVYIDISSEDAWLKLAKAMLEKLKMLIVDKRFVFANINSVEAVLAWVKSPRVLKAITKNPRIIHGDLRADQVFVKEEGYYVIDWQRPMIAPPEVDMVSLLIDQHMDPRKYVDREVIGIFWFLRLNWALEAQFDLFPKRRWPLFEHWAMEAIGHILEVKY